MTAPAFGRPVPPTFGAPGTATAERPERPNPPEVPTIGAQLGMDGTELTRTVRAQPQRVSLWDRGDTR